MRRVISRGILLTAIVLVSLFTLPAFAQKAPDAFTQEVLIKSTLITFNDANITGNYAVLHAKLSKLFRDKFSPDQLKAAFKGFHDNKIDFDIIVAKPPVPRQPARVNDNGVLLLYGHFDTTPRQMHYELEYMLSDGEWKPSRILVQFK